MEEYSDENVQRKMKKMKALRKTGKVLLTTVIAVIVIVNAMILLKKNMYPNDTPDLLGYKAFVINSSSQNQSLDINDGDFIMVNKNTQVNVGDIIIYNDGGTIHNDRVVEKAIEGSNLQYIVKNGDNEVKVNRSQVEGIYMYKIPGAGGVALFLSNIWVSGALLLLIIAMQFDSLRLENRKKIRKQKRLSYENRKVRKESI